MNAHVPTMFLMLIVVSGTLAVAVSTVARSRNRDGMVWWSAGLLLYTAAYLLYSRRGQISDVYTVVLANVALITVTALFAEGLLQFQQRRLSRWWFWSAVPITALFFSVFIDKLAYRVIVGSAITAAQCTVLLVILLQKRRETVGRGQYFVASGLLAAVAVFVYRAAVAASDPASVSPSFDASAVGITTVLVSVICLILLGMGFVLMTKERADERNRVLAMRDELTGLANRRSVIASLTQQMAQAQRIALPLTLLILDVDHFKRINDSFGHLSGDLALQNLASLLQTRLRTQDIFGRFGGEEFLIILPNTGAADALRLTESLRVSVATTRFESLNGESMPVTISVGLHTQRLGTDQHCDDMISAADQALYRAKDSGRNRVEVFSPPAGVVPVALDLFPQA